MDVEALLQPVSDDAPGGEDLYGDPQRTEIELAFEPDAEEVDWRRIVSLIEDQAGRTKDVWLGIYLARAGVKMGRLDTALAGTEFLAGMFERYWDTMHPALDDLGFQGRKGPCESLTRIGEFIGPLRRTTLITHPRLGSYTGEDLQRFDEEGDAADGFGMFRAAVAETDEADIQAALASLDAMRAAVKRADAVLVAQADGDTGTDFTPTYDAIDAIRRALAPYAGSDADEASELAEGEVDAGGAGGGQRIAGRVESRDDVIRAIDAIADYYQRREPASPIPVALRRIRGWVTMDFMAILKDISPDGMSQAETVLLARKEEEDSGY